MKMLYFNKCFASVEMVMWFLFSLLMWCIIFIHSHFLSHLCIPGIILTWSMKLCLSDLFIWALIAIIANSAFAVSQMFWYVVLLFSLISRYFLNFLFDCFCDSLSFRSILSHLHLSASFLVFLRLLISSFFSLWSERIHVIVSYFEFVETW